MIWTPDGPQPIEQIKKGTRVLTFAASSSRLVAYAVVETFRGGTNRIRELKVGGTSVSTTLNHRFYVADRGWCAARDLKAGDLVVSTSGDQAIESIEEKTFDRDVETFNLHIAELHTYLVGSGILVHNNNPDWERELWWLFGKKAVARPTDVDGVSLWRTQNAKDVEDMFRIRRSIDGRSSSDPHQAYTADELAANGVVVEATPGNGPMSSRLQHGSARPTGSLSGDLDLNGITTAVDGINRTTPSAKASPKAMGCK